MARPKFIKNKWFSTTFISSKVNTITLFYVGYTENLRRRLKEHNNKEELSTKDFTPYDLIHYEAYRSMKDAKRREQYLKTTKGKTTLKTMLKEFLAENHNATQTTLQPYI